MSSHYKGLAHISIQTRDIEKSISFYTEQLDFEVTYRTVVNPDGPRNGFFPLQYVLLERGSCAIEMLQPDDIDSVKTGIEGIVGHFAIEVDDLDAVMKQLSGAGLLAADAQPALFPNLYKGSKATHITGPSGEIIELFEYTR